MALAPNTRPAPFGAIATFNFVNMFEGVVKSVSDWNAKRQTQKILTALSDRELADIWPVPRRFGQPAFQILRK